MDCSASQSINVVNDFLTRSEKEKNIKELYLCFGPMFSGKTTTLINLINIINPFIKDKEHIFYKCVNHNKDVRVLNDFLSSHNKILNNVYNCDKYEHLCRDELLKPIEKKRTTLLLIDESQFFNDLYEFIKILYTEEHYADKNIIIFCFSLNSDFKRNVFGQTHLLIPFATHVEILKGKCDYCNSTSITSHLREHSSSSNTNIIIGGIDKFIPLCNLCYLKNNLNM